MPPITITPGPSDISGMGGFGIGRISPGLYYASALSWGTIGTLAMAVGELKFAPFYLRTGKVERFSGLAAQLSAVVASSFLRFGIWATGSDGRPGTLILDAGQVATDVGTTKEASLGDIALAPGDYWMGVAAQGLNPVTIRHYPTAGPKINCGFSIAASEALAGGTTLGTTGVTGAFSSSPAVTLIAQTPVLALKSST